MTESIKFGPEWLRNSVANHAASDPPPLANQPPNLRPQLADYRYGREEMLSLCGNSPRAPDCLAKYRKLFVATAQLPLALTPPTDDEGRVWLPPRTTPSQLGIVRGGGRGSSVDRGRGRARGLYHSGLGYQRAGQYEDEGRGAGRGDRLWLDRNGVGDTTVDWNNPAAVSPRKEYGGASAALHGRANMENWRKSTRTDEEGAGSDWRNPTATGGTATAPGGRDKWQRSTSWREEDVGVPYSPDAPAPRATGTNGTSAAPRGRRPGQWGEEDPHLPEWATENPSDYGGSFDAAGAFHDSDDDQPPPGGYNGHEARREAKREAKRVVEPVEEPHEAPPTEILEVEPKVDQRQLQEDYERHLLQQQLLQQPFHAVAAAPPPPPSQEYQSAEEVADYMVANLIMDDDPAHSDLYQKEMLRQRHMQQQQVAPPGPAKHQLDSWYYRDPQGEQQGPFAATEMAEWYKAGYFLESLFVWRACDTRYSTLGELVKLCGGGVPFLTPTHIPPQLPPQQQPQPQPQVHQPDAQALQMFQKHVILQQLSADIEGWNMMTPEQQHILLTYHLQHLQNRQTNVAPTNDFQSATNFYHKQQLQQQKTQQQQQQVTVPVKNVAQASPKVTQQPSSQVPLEFAAGGRGLNYYPAQGQPQMQQQVPSVPPVDNPIKNLLMQLSQQKSGQQHVDANPAWFKQQVQQQSGVPAQQWQPQHQPLSMWEQTSQQPEAHEHQALEEQLLKNSEMQHGDLMRKKEAKRDIPQAAPQRKDSAEREKEERKRQKELKRLQEEDLRRKQQHQQMQMQAEEKKRQQEIEEKKRIEELEREKAAAKYAEMQRDAALVVAARQQEKLRQRQQLEQEQRSTTAARVAPWSQGFQSQVTATGPSLAEIQKAEREALRRAEQVRGEQQMREMAALEQSHRDTSAAKWQSHRPQHTLSLAEIQAEEKLRQAAQAEGQAAQAAATRKEKKEMEPQAPSGANQSIWSQNAQLVWNNTQPKSWGGGSGGSTSQGGFWEEPTKSKAPPANNRQQLLKSQTLTNMSAAASAAKQHQPPGRQAKRPEGVKKQQPPPTNKKDDISAEFSVWCTKAISAMGGQVDVPTFVGFLQDIESPFEVKDYIKMYLGETKECAEFGKQFLERRSKYKNQLRAANAHIDDMCQPAPAITPSSAGASGDFQEVKGRQQKVKKTKPLKLDIRNLGFSVTAAPDRLNVGDRDYGDAS